MHLLEPTDKTATATVVATTVTEDTYTAAIAAAGKDPKGDNSIATVPLATLVSPGKMAQPAAEQPAAQLVSPTLKRKSSTKIAHAPATNLRVPDHGQLC